MNSPFDQKTEMLFDQAIKHEWLESNGIGGYASSTITGTNTRRYHGLLVASLNPPVERMLMVSKMDETIHIGENAYELATNQYWNSVAPNGYQHLIGFDKNVFTHFLFDTEEILLKKTIGTFHGENTTWVKYEVLMAKSPFELELKPFFAMRDFHSLRKATQYHSPFFIHEEDCLTVNMGDGGPSAYIQLQDAEFAYKPDWYYNFEYKEELSRGQEGHEDLFTPGQFQIQLKEGDTICILLSAEKPTEKNIGDKILAEQERRIQIMDTIEGADPFIKRLSLASDQFIVQRGKEGTSILAGYHWFSDWGRDTMISLPGLCLSTGRFELAKEILEEFSHHISEGMLPNRFDDYGKEAHYNTVDGTLWYFIAAYKYYKATQDKEFVLDELLPYLEEILWWHERGTRYNIHAANDGLLYAGQSGFALTWMDAKVGNWVVTPRIGKCVEINALWYNAWMIVSFFYEELKDKKKSGELFQKALKIKESFSKTFWNPFTSSLYDYVNSHISDDSIRPNQLFAISLPFGLLEPEQADKVLRSVEEHLYTPVGLRSLAKDHPAYLSVYEGDQVARDASYHQGIVWSWLIGPYIDALAKVRGLQGIRQAKKVLKNMQYHLDEAGIGNISEIFDAEAPYTPRGCVAQAWGVAELLRVCVDYKLWDPVKRVTVPASKKTTSSKVKNGSVANKKKKKKMTSGKKDVLPAK